VQGDVRGERVVFDFEAFAAGRAQTKTRNSGGDWPLSRANF